MLSAFLYVSSFVVYVFSFLTSTKHISQFAVSGETESFGSNNLMGQWLKAIGGYTVEKIGAHSPSAFIRPFPYPVALLTL